MIDDHRKDIEHNTLFLRVNAPQLGTAGYPSQRDLDADRQARQRNRMPTAVADDTQDIESADVDPCDDDEPVEQHDPDEPGHDSLSD